MMLILAVLVLIAAVLLPTILSPGHHHHRSPIIYCANNLQQVELSFRTWAIDNNGKYPMEVSMTNGGSMELAQHGNAAATFLHMSNEIYAPKLLVCPADKSRTVASSFGDLRNENISYFIGVDATQTNAAAFLIGDRNLSLGNAPVKPGLVSFTTNDTIGWTTEIHNRQGNIGLGDGSVQFMTISKLQQALQTTGFVANRLAIP